jgi:hypothetical protein
LPLLLIAPWMMVIVGVPMLGLTTLLTALRRSAKGGLIYTAGIVSAYLIVRQLVTVSMHVNLPPLFAGPVIWLMNNKPFAPLSAFPWGALGRAVLLSAAFPLAAQYLLERTEVYGGPVSIQGVVSWRSTTSLRMSSARRPASTPSMFASTTTPASRSGTTANAVLVPCCPPV